MRFATRACAAAILVCGLSGAAQAQLLYSFEDNLDGFFATGGSSVAASTTTGVTKGTTALQYSLITPATFEGARTETVIPAALANPPGVNEILFDLTLTDQFAGGFASLGVTFFGYSPSLMVGNQLQMADFIAVEALTPGTYTDLSIATDVSFGGGPSFNDFFGGVTDYVPTGFQFFINKSGTAPITVYIDNVRAVVPEPATLGLVALGAACGLAARRR